MIPLELCYPDNWSARGRRESVVSSFVPSIGMEIASTHFSGNYKVVRLSTSSNGSVLGDTVYVDLEEAD